MKLNKTRLPAVFSILENKANLFYILAFAPLLLILYHNPFNTVISFYGFLLLIMKKFRLFSYQEATLIQKLFGFLIIISSPFIHLALLPFFPWAIHYGPANYATHILGLFLVFFNITALKEAFAPVFLIIAPSAAPIASRWAESYLKPLLPFFTSLVVTIINVVGIKAVIHNSHPTWIVMYTPNGTSTSQIIWACIGFESAFVFAIVLILLLSEGPGNKKTKILWSAVGLLGTLLLNIFRVVLLFVTNYVFGMRVSTTVHYFVGYVLFIVWITAFLFLFLKREAIQGKIKLVWRKLSIKVRRIL